MKNCIIYAFSGTGNSLLISGFVQKYLQELHGIETTIYRIRYPLVGEIPNPNDFDYVGFCYPIYGFNAPAPFNTFIKSFPKSNTKGKPFFILKDSGEPFAVNSASSSHFVGKMKRKGYKPVLEHHYLMTYNIMFRYKDNLAKQMYLYNRELTKVMADDIAAENYQKISYNFIYRLISIMVRLVWVAGFFNAKLTHVDKKKCTNCDMCIRNCPTNSIYRDKNGKIKLHTTCCICMACSFNCPHDAFKMGFLNPWRVNGRFDFQKFANDDSLNGKFVNKRTTGYFKMFRKYFRKQNEILLAHGYDLPVKYTPEENLSTKK